MTRNAAIEASLYVHVPFCLSKCAYCDFASTSVVDAGLRSAYLRTLREHIGRWQQTRVFAGGLPSLYVGGGTPTLLGDDLVELVTWISSRIGVRSGAEVTIETNPDTTDERVIASLVAAGTTRFSLGVQSFDDSVLRFLGRCHDAESAEKAAAVLRSAGADFSVDLICGVPGLTEGMWHATLERAIATDAAHVSVYPLAVEEGTPLSARIDAGTVPDIDPDRAAADMQAAARVLSAAGYARYEVANYARPGREARHNLGYWTGRPYVGVGPSAASMLPTDDGGRRRFAYPGAVDEWLSSDPLDVDAEVLTAQETAREDVMLALRLTAGVPVAQVFAAGVSLVIEQLLRRGLLERVDDRVRTTERGWLLGNEVFEAVLFD